MDGSCRRAGEGDGDGDGDGDGEGVWRDGRYKSGLRSSSRKQELNPDRESPTEKMT